MQNEIDRHLNSYVHDIINFLKACNASVSFSDLYTKLKIDIHSNPKLLSALQKNDKIKIHNNLIEYIYNYDIKSKEDLIEIFKSKKEGIELSKLKDNKIDISEFLEDFIVIKDNDGSEVVFYNDFDCKKLDEDVVSLWKSISIPGYQDLLAELNAAGLKMQKNEVMKKKTVLKKKNEAKRYRRKLKITNTHVKGLDLSGLDN